MSLSPPTNPILLIDADGLLWTPATIFEQEDDWGDSLSITFDFAVACEWVTSKISKLQEHLEPSQTILALSGFGNFRKNLLPSYKGNRKGKRAPIGMNKMREWLKENYTVVEKPLLEADDQIGILATKPENREKCIIVSEDKDMLQIPGWHLRDGKLLHVTEEEADRFHLYQTLVGDTADNYGGAWRVGPVKAKTILNRPQHIIATTFSDKGKPLPVYEECSPWEAVEQAFRTGGGTNEDALKMARVSRILRWSDWDVEKQEVKLWTPHAA